MSEPLRLTVNGVEVHVPSWARWRDAVTVYGSAAGAALATGDGFLADETGEPVDPDGAVVAGARIWFHETEDRDAE